jgi:hypothetical protein
MKTFAILIPAVIALSLSYSRVESKEIIFASLSHGGVERFDTAGTPLGGFPSPMLFSIAADSNGNVYGALMGSSGLRLSADGTVRNAFIPYGPSPLVAGAAVGPDGNFYLGVVSSGSPNRTVERFTPDGTSLGIFVQGSVALDLVFDAFGNMYVNEGHSISKFDPTGVPLRTFARTQDLIVDIAIDKLGNIYTVTNLAPKSFSTPITQYGPYGQLMHTFDPGFYTAAVAVDQTGILFVSGLAHVAGRSPGVIRRFLPDGTPLGEIYQSPLPPRQRHNEVMDLVILNINPEPSSLVLAIFASSVCGLMSRRRRSYRADHTGRSVSP